MSILKINDQSIQFTPPALLSTLLEKAGFSQAHPCGGRGTCGKCAVTIMGELAPLTKAEQRAGTRLSCQTVLLDDATLYSENSTAMQIESTVDLPNRSESQTSSPQLCPAAAIDIGTTTVVVQVYDLYTGTLLGSAADLNPQGSVAADVMGRINAALNGKSKLLQEQITDKLAELLHQAAGEHFAHLKRMVVTGNTTMLYLLTGRNPQSLATAPFLADELFDKEELLLGIPTYYPPCISAFVGADITCALLHSSICEDDQTALLCDIGTNGELALWHNGHLTVTSTAAGPVFEGAGIRQGMLGKGGAIERVTVENGALVCQTIGDLPPRGICGSGLIDAVAMGLELELIDETGFLEEDPLPLTETVSLFGADIRNLQLAKSAIAAGIGALLRHADLTSVNTCQIAGGFGKRLNLISARRIGLLPDALGENTVIIGNAALAGAAELLLQPERSEHLRSLIAGAEHFELGGDPVFNELYIDNMYF